MKSKIATGLLALTLIGALASVASANQYYDYPSWAQKAFTQHE